MRRSVVYRVSYHLDRVMRNRHIPSCQTSNHQGSFHRLADQCPFTEECHLIPSDSHTVWEEGQLGLRHKLAAPDIVHPLYRNQKGIAYRRMLSTAATFRAAAQSLYSFQKPVQYKTKAYWYCLFPKSCQAEGQSAVVGLGCPKYAAPAIPSRGAEDERSLGLLGPSTKSEL